MPWFVGHGYSFELGKLLNELNSDPRNLSLSVRTSMTRVGKPTRRPFEHAWRAFGRWSSLDSWLEKLKRSVRTSRSSVQTCKLFGFVLRECTDPFEQAWGLFKFLTLSGFNLQFETSSFERAFEREHPIWIFLAFQASIPLYKNVVDFTSSWKGFCSPFY